MSDPTPKNVNQNEVEKPASSPQSDQDSQELEDAQAEAAEEREDEGGYQ